MISILFDSFHVKAKKCGNTRVRKCMDWSKFCLDYNAWIKTFNLSIYKPLKNQIHPFIIYVLMDIKSIHISS